MTNWELRQRLMSYFLNKRLLQINKKRNTFLVEQWQMIELDSSKKKIQVADRFTFV